MNNQRLFFLHNPKAGGMSLRIMFQEAFGVEAVAPVVSNGPNDHRSVKSTVVRYRGYDFYAGHYGYEDFGELAEGHRLITNFRAPVSRIVSLYRFWRNNVPDEYLQDIDSRDAEVVRFAKELDFSSFIRCDHPDLLLFISNFHFRQLHWSPWERATIRLWDKLRVKRRIAEMPWFYVAELPHASAFLMQQVFPELRDASIPFANSTHGDKIAVSGADVAHIARLNDLDYEIYDYAFRLQNRRLGKAAAGL